MIISTSAYFTIGGIIAILAIFPALYGKITKTESKLKWTWVILLLLMPINWFFPAVYDVTDCGEYTKKVLIFPNSEYKMGMHNYVINNSDKDLFFEYLFYGNERPDKDQVDMIIVPGTIYQAPTTTIAYLFEPAPESIQAKGDGSMRNRLSCDVPSYELNESDIQNLIEEMGVKDEDELKEVFRQELDLSDSLDLSQYSLQELLEMGSEIN